MDFKLYFSLCLACVQDLVELSVSFYKLEKKLFGQDKNGNAFVSYQDHLVFRDFIMYPVQN